MQFTDKLPLVTVVIPTYKRPDMIERAVKSVLNQTYRNIEIIIVDDNGEGSEFQLETAKIVELFEDKVVYLIHPQNKGGSAARNTGWRNSNGKYITFLDDDDEIDVTKIEKQVMCLENLSEDWGACYTGYKLLKENGENQISSENRSGDCYIYALMKTMFMGSGSNLFLRKSVVDEINGYDESFVRNQDIEFMARALEHYKLAYIDEILLTIYQEGNRKQRTLEEIEKINNYYISKFKDRIDNLNEKDRERVWAVISLERFRAYIYDKKTFEGIKLLKHNKVKTKYVFRYMKYLLHRTITHKSYGFDGR